MKNKRRLKIAYGSILTTSMLFVLIFILQAQQPPPNRGTRIVELKKAALLYKTSASEAQILKDSVVLYHDGAYMYCDSAYMYEKTNSFEAFSNVRMEQGDTIFVYSDYLFYDGNTRIAKLRDNVRMEDRTTTLFTDSLNYDRNQNLGYYFEGGMLVDDENELSSFWGQYAPDTKDALFSDSVKLINPDYTIYSNTLKYNTATKIANILGPSTIESDSGTIYTTNGWYNTFTDDAQLYNRSKVYNKERSKVLIGDTILYNKQTGIGKVYGNMFLQDTIQKAILQGNSGFYNEKTEYAFATDSAFAIDYSQKDSLFLHGDSLIMQSDSLGRNIKAYYNVRFFRADLQGICDSMQYVSSDSILYMYRNPVLWSDNNQILGEEINIYLNDSTIEKAHVKDYALAIQSRNIEGQYNQLSGRDLVANFVNGAIRNILVEGNAESLYYTLNEQDSTIIGLNRTESAFLSMDIKENKLEKLKLWPSPKGLMTPLELLKPDESQLKGFSWLDYLRPKDKSDIFRRNSRESSDVPAPRKKFIRD